MVNVPDFIIYFLVSSCVILLFVFDMSAEQTVFIFLAVIGTLLLTLSVVKSLKGSKEKLSKSERKHKNNIQKAHKILSKLKQFDQDGAIINYLKKIDPYVFEELLLICFENAGFKVERNASYSGDGGLDGKVFFKGKTYLVQAKRYNKSISSQHLKEFSKTVFKFGADGGFFVHSGRTPKWFLKDPSSNYQLISGDRLVKLIKS